MPETGFRLYLDASYGVAPWPFARSWRECVADQTLKWPGSVPDFDIFLPDDEDDRTHDAIEREHATTRTEMAVYRDSDALIVLLRLWDGAPLATRFAPPQEDGAMIWIGSHPHPQELIYLGVNRRGEMLAMKHRDIHPKRSGHRPASSVLKNESEVAAVNFEGGWQAALRLNLGAIEQSGNTLSFNAGRMWGETCEPQGWSTAPIWFPMLSQMGTLHLGAPPAPKPKIHRVDFLYDAEAEVGDLRLTMAGLTGRKAAAVSVTVNTRQQQHVAAGEIRQSFTPEDGHNVITVQVEGQSPVVVNFEKWSGHRLFPRYGSPLPLPDVAALRVRFACVHKRHERGYRGAGRWSNSINYEAEPHETPVGKEGLDHNCAFPMEAYALAYLHLDNNDVYKERVEQACERMLREEQPGGYFFCRHSGGEGYPFLGGAFTQGSVGEALLLGYRIFGDEKYLAASQRAAQAYDIYSLEPNTNYMAFALWHLSELFELTGDCSAIERAVWYARHGIIRGMNPSGAHPGHNYYSTYGDITLKGMAKLLRVLPAGHEFYATLRERTIRYTNQMLSRQCANGLFEGRNRMYFGYRHTCNGLFEVARALPEFSQQLTPALIAMINAQFNDVSMGEPIGIKELALMGRHVKEKLS